MFWQHAVKGHMPQNCIHVWAIVCLTFWITWGHVYWQNSDCCQSIQLHFWGHVTSFHVKHIYQNSMSTEPCLNSFRNNFALTLFFRYPCSSWCTANLLGILQMEMKRQLLSSKTELFSFLLWLDEMLEMFLSITFPQPQLTDKKKPFFPPNSFKIFFFLSVDFIPHSVSG